MMKKQMMATMGLLALAGCGGSGSDGTGNRSAEGSRAAPSAAASDLQIEPGLWETKVEFVKVEGVPKEVAAAMTGRADQTDKNCITPEEVKQANAGMFAGEDQKNCKQEGFAFRGGRLNGKLTCTGGDTPGTMTLEMNGTYTARTYEMTNRMSTDVQGMKMVMESRMTGRRVGECSAEQAREG